MAGKISAAAIVLLLSASLAFGEAPKEAAPRRGSSSGQDRKAVHRLEEVRITGSAEHPGVLFFLPRAKFRLLPLRDPHGGKERFFRETRGTGEFP